MAGLVGSSSGRTVFGRFWRRAGRPDPDASLRWPHGPAGALLRASPPWLVSVWRSGPRPLQALDIHRSATSTGGKGNHPSGGGGWSAGSPPPGAGHHRPGWRASPPPPASVASGWRPGPAGWRAPETSTEIQSKTVCGGGLKLGSEALST